MDRQIDPFDIVDPTVRCGAATDNNPILSSKDAWDGCLHAAHVEDKTKITFLLWREHRMHHCSCSWCPVGFVGALLFVEAVVTMTTTTMTATIHSFDPIYCVLVRCGAVWYIRLFSSFPLFVIVFVFVFVFILRLAAA